MEACERPATRVPRPSGCSPKIFREKYNRFTMENARQLQCKALGRLQKIRWRNNDGEQWKKQCAEQWKQWDTGRVLTPAAAIALLARADLRLSEILARLKIQAIYREFTGKRPFAFFGRAAEDRDLSQPALRALKTRRLRAPGAKQRD